MSSPATEEPYGYFAEEPVHNSAIPSAIPSVGYLEPEDRAMLPGVPLTAEHTTRTSRSFYPVGSRHGVFGNISAGFRLLPTCWAALMADPTLLLVPIVVLFVGGVASAGYIAAFGGLAHLFTGGRGAVAVKTLPLTVVLAVVSVVGRAVVVADATQRLQGAKPRIDVAWRLTVTRLPALIGFGVAQAVESTMTAALRNSAAGRLAANVADKAWDFATFLAVPAILFEKAGPLKAVRRSGLLVASRWGTQLTAQAVLSFAIAACTIPLAVAAIVVASVNAALGIALLVAILLAAIAVSSALNGILSAAMYRYATTGLLAPGFAESDMWSVFAGR
jgi:Family of unknown function (DUF6159)